MSTDERWLPVPGWDRTSRPKENLVSHVYAPDFDKAAEEDGDVLFVPCKICGKGPGGDHRPLDSLDPTHNRDLRRCHGDDR